MAQRPTRQHDKPPSDAPPNSSAHSGTGAAVSSHIQRTERQGRRAEESIIAVNCLPYQVVEQANFSLYQPTWQPNPYHYNLAYRNFLQAVFQPNLSQTYFNRQQQERGDREGRRVSRSENKDSLSGLRLWEQVSGGNPNKAGFIFSVMSYNVLAQDLIDQHPYLYTLHRKDTLQWQIRWNNLLREIKQHKPDILCMQEVQGSHLEQYYSQLENLGYKGLYKQRTGIRTDGCAIYYKTNLVTLVEHATVEYNQPNIPILDRDNIAMIAKFAPKNHPSREFIIATTHLLYNPKRQDVRLAQTQLFLTELERIAFHQGRYLPLIMTGDLNSTPDSAVYRFITKSSLKYEDLAPRSLQNNSNGPRTGKKFLPTSLRITDNCQHADLIPKRMNNETISRSEELSLIELKHSERQDKKNKGEKADADSDLFSSGTLKHKFSLKSVYDHVIGGDLEGTTYQDEWLTVDYIFFSVRNKLSLLERFRLPTKRQLGTMMIPNAGQGSDHFSLLAKFKLEV